ncbi:MAG: hypothetical protein K0R50_2428 [Eubacterium sp.]|nr:hypothetical protein [Eubacterium sp.]
MQKSDLDNFCFFKNKDGTYDVVSMALNCFEASVYNVVKNNKALEKDQVIPLFINDLNPTLWFNNTSGIFRIYNQSRNLSPLWKKYITVHKVVKKRDKNAAAFLESLLDIGQMVIIQTVFERVKHLAWYNPNFDLDLYYEGEEQHANIAVYHEDDRIYFSEKIPYNIHKENYVPYEYNSQIGVALKSEIEEACNYFLRCYTLEVNERELNSGNTLENDIVNIIHAMADNFKGDVEEVNGYTRCYGTSALEKLKEYCNEGIDLKKYFITQGWTIKDRVAFDIWMFHGSRQILLEYLILKEKRHGGNPGFTLLKESLSEAIIQWQTLERSISKLLQSGFTKLNPKIGMRIDNLLVVENNLNNQLKAYK